MTGKWLNKGGFVDSGHECVRPSREEIERAGAIDGAEWQCNCGLVWQLFESPYRIHAFTPWWRWNLKQKDAAPKSYWSQDSSPRMIVDKNP